MRGIIFEFGTDLIEVRIDGANLWFRSSAYGTQFVTIDQLYISKEGAMIEHPDLIGNPAWRTIAIGRLKDKLEAMNSEQEIEDYIIDELKKFGYLPKYRQINGFRAEAIK